MLAAAGHGRRSFQGCLDPEGGRSANRQRYEASGGWPTPRLPHRRRTARAYPMRWRRYSITQTRSSPIPKPSLQRGGPVADCEKANRRGLARRSITDIQSAVETSKDYWRPPRFKLKAQRESLLKPFQRQYIHLTVFPASRPWRTGRSGSCLMRKVRYGETVMACRRPAPCRKDMKRQGAGPRKRASQAPHTRVSGGN